MLRSLDHVFQIVPIFDKDHKNMSFHGNQIEDIVAILLLKTFHWHSKCIKMESFWRMFSMTRFYTKKLVLDEIYTIFQVAHISLNNCPRISNPNTLEYPFPSAVHIYSLINLIQGRCFNVIK